MPRVKLAGEVYKDKDMAELIRRYKYGKRLTNADMAKIAGIGQTKWKSWLADPSLIPVGKLRLIQKKLQIPKEELLPFLM